MSTQSMLRIALLCVLPLTSTACSWILVHAPPPDHERLVFFTCSRSRAVPVVDLLAAGITAGYVAWVLTLSETEVASRYTRSKGGIVTTNTVFGAMTGVSAISGFKKVSECRAATALLQERLTSTPVTPSAAPSLEAIGLRPPPLFPARRPLDSAPIMLTRPKPEVAPRN